MNDHNEEIIKASFHSNGQVHTYDNKHCLLLVSVGQKYHEDKRLSATVDLINQSNFKSCTIAVADTLQRHNYPAMLPEDAYLYALESGNEWLDRNAECLSRLKPAVTLLKWDEALQDAGYAALKQQVENEYHNNPDYHSAVNATINVFIDRVKKRDDKQDLVQAFQNCLTYLIEECPIIMPLWAMQGFDFIIYPKQMTDAMAKTRELFVQNQFPDKCNWLSLNFKKKFISGNLQQKIAVNA